jgi:hypothetical protein
MTSRLALLPCPGLPHLYHVSLLCVGIFQLAHTHQIHNVPGAAGGHTEQQHMAKGGRQLHVSKNLVHRPKE